MRPFNSDDKGMTIIVHRFKMDHFYELSTSFVPLPASVF